jgi:hypothetical protein
MKGSVQLELLWRKKGGHNREGCKRWRCREELRCKMMDGAELDTYRGYGSANLSKGGRELESERDKRDMVG